VTKSLKVLMLAHHRRLKIGGRSYPIAKALVRKGHQVTLLVISNRRRFGTIESEDQGIRIIETPDLLWGRLRSGWDPWDTLNRFVYLRRDSTPYDLVHCFETRPATIYPALDYLRRNPIPLITDWNDWWGRGGIIDEARPAWYRSLFGSIETYYEEAFRMQGAGLTVISTALRRRAVDLGIDRERICYLPGGVQEGALDVPDKTACRQWVAAYDKQRGSVYSGTDPILGFASADSHWDLEIIMDALVLVVDKYPQTRLVVTGKAGEQVLALARERGVENNVELTGWLEREALPYYLGCADVFLLPFPDEIRNIGRWPNKIGLYMGVGRPTVTNAVGDIKPLFEQHDVGLVAEWDPLDFAHKILYLLENPDTAGRLGQQARRLAATEYHWDHLIVRLETFYDTILAGT
jgi:glycosyltransferase involved in cell wall biosynthesis